MYQNYYETGQRLFLCRVWLTTLAVPDSEPATAQELVNLVRAKKMMKSRA